MMATTPNPTATAPHGPRAVPIAKLPTARRYNSEAKENMNCKSCRKRKIKCSRTRPSCNACDVFRCECVYDAVPKKRGPKTEVLEELLKRIDGLEKRLGESEGGRDQTSPATAGSECSVGAEVEMQDDGAVIQPHQSSSQQGSQSSQTPKKRRLSTSPVPPSSLAAGPRLSADSTSTLGPMHIKMDGPREPNLTPKLVDVFFRRVNGKPYSFFHEKTFRDGLAAGTMSSAVLNSVCAVSVRYIPIEELGAKSVQQHAEEFANTARSQVDADEPTLENLQAMLVLSMTFYAMGYGKKAWMQMGSAIRMTLALDLHRELPASHPATPLQREIRRRVFWTCYLMDRFTVSGSMRPPQLSDRSINLRLPSSNASYVSGSPIESPFFSATGTYTSPMPQPHSNRLVDIVRILGRTIRYTQSGGVKGDSHFPWHSASHLSRIRTDLNTWASLTRDLHSNIPETPDATCLFLARAIWHVIHCLMYRNFLPIDLAELEGQGTQQAWQMEAVKVCFQHANALVDLIGVAEVNTEIEWPAFAGFALATAASVLVHGVFYRSEAFRRCKESLELVTKKVKALRAQWACMAQHLYTLRLLRLSHELLSTSQPRISVFHLDDFFDRYSSVRNATGATSHFESCHVPFADTPASIASADSPSYPDTPPPSSTSGYPRPQYQHQHQHQQQQQQHQQQHQQQQHQQQQMYQHQQQQQQNPQRQPQQHHQLVALTTQSSQPPNPHSPQNPYSPVPIFPNPNNITDFLFPHDMGFSWISDWPVSSPQPPSTPQLDEVVPRIQGGLGFRKALYDEELVNEAVLPFAAIAAEHEEDDEVDMDPQQRFERAQHMHHQQQQQQAHLHHQHQHQQHQQQHQQQRLQLHRHNTDSVQMDSAVQMVDPPSTTSASTGGGDDELLSMLAEMAEREEMERRGGSVGMAGNSA